MTLIDPEKNKEVLKEAAILIGGDAYSKLKEIVAEKQFKASLIQVCQSITNYLDKNSFLTEDVKNMLSDKRLKHLIDETIMKNGFSFEVDLSKGFYVLFDSYEIPTELRKTCFRMLWQSIDEYLIVYHKDFYQSVLIDEIHTESKKTRIGVEENNKLLKRITEDLRHGVKSKGTSDNIESSNLYSLIEHVVQDNGDRHYHVFLDSFSVPDIFVDNCTRYKKIITDSDTETLHKLRLDEFDDCCLSDILTWIESDRLVLIEGLFGTGKTTLSLQLQHKLSPENKTWFIRAYDLFNIFNENDFSENNYDLHLKDKLYLFIDSIDKIITFKTATQNESLISDFAEKVLKLMLKNQQLYVIVNTRPYYSDVRESDKMVSISELISFFSIMHGIFPTVVFPIGFLPKKGSGTSSRLDEFFRNLGMAHKSSSIITKADAKRIHPDVPTSCQVPIFAYIFGSFFYNECEGDIRKLEEKDPLEIYLLFVEKTLKGMYSTDQNRLILSKSSTNSNSNFKLFFKLIQQIAVKSLCQSKNDISLSEKNDTKNILDCKSNTFAISLELFDKTTQEIVSNAIKTTNKTGHYFINYYFFDLFPIGSEYYVRFSDNNVLYCLVSKHYFEHLKFLQSSSIDCSKKYPEAKSNIGEFEFQYQVVDYIISITKSIKDDDDKIKGLIASNCLELLYYANNTIPKDFETIKLMILLSILFLKFNKEAYSSYNVDGVSSANHFFKEFDWLFKAYKALDPSSKHTGNHRFLIERYFMDSQIYDAKFKRINLKHYNFQGSRLKNVDFIQCKLSDTLFTDSTIGKVMFSLCQFVPFIDPHKEYKEIPNNSVDFNYASVRETVTFQDTYIKNAFFTNINMKHEMSSEEDQKTGTMQFNNCRLENVIIHKVRKVKLKFENCILTNVRILECGRLPLIIDDKCTISSDYKTGKNTKHLDKILYKDSSFSGSLQYLKDIEEIL